MKSIGEDVVTKSSAQITKHLRSKFIQRTSRNLSEDSPQSPWHLWKTSAASRDFSTTSEELLGMLEECCLLAVPLCPRAYDFVHLPWILDMQGGAVAAKATALGDLICLDFLQNNL